MKKRNVKMRLGRNPLPEAEVKQQLWIYAQTQHIELLGGKEEAKKLLNKVFAQLVLNHQNKNNETETNIDSTEV